MQEIEIPYVELKSLVIESINKHGESFEFKNLCNSVGDLAISKKMVVNQHKSNSPSFYSPLHINDENRVREILWDFIIERVLTIGDYHNDSWPHLSLTEYGKKAFTSENPSPNDSSRYLERIKKEIPKLDKTIETYLTESVRTYNINQLLSATITLGCASEKALLILIETFRDTYEDKTKQNNFTNKIKGKFIKAQFDQFDTEFQKIKKDLPYELRTDHIIILNGIFEIIRKNRNEAGHPTGNKVDKDTLFANLQVFITYCKYIYNLKNYFEKNKH